MTRRILVRLRALEPLHIGHEVSTTPTFLDSKTFRLVRKDGRVIAIPGSTMKGALRSRFEDHIRGRLARNHSEAVELARKAYIELRQALEEIEQILVHSGATRPRLVEALEAMAVRERELDLSGLMSDKPYESAPYAYLPLVCDPLSQLHCNPLTSFLEFGEDAQETVRLVASYVLLRRAPHGPHYCPACTVFGGNGYASRAKFNNLETDASVTALQTRVSIDRLTGAARHAKLFTTEYIPPGIEFTGEIEVDEKPRWAPDQCDPAEIIYALLRLGDKRCDGHSAAGRTTMRLGKYKSVGYGTVEVEAQPLDGARGPDPCEVLEKCLDEWLRKLEKSLCDEYAECQPKGNKGNKDEKCSLANAICRSTYIQTELAEMSEDARKNVCKEIAQVIIRHALNVLNLAKRSIHAHT